MPQTSDDSLFAGGDRVGVKLLGGRNGVVCSTPDAIHARLASIVGIKEP